MGKNGKIVLVGISAALLGGSGGLAHASLIASDNVANNPPYGGYTGVNGLNGGSGFGAWSAGNVSGTSGGDFTWQGTNLTTPGGAGGFDLYDNGIEGRGSATDEYAAIRPFTGGALAVNQQFSFVDQLNNGSAGSNGPCNLGFSLDDSSGNALFDFHAVGGSGYYLSDATQSDTSESTVGYNYHAIDNFAFELTSVGATTAAYSFTVSGGSGSIAGGSQTFTGTISMATGGISQVEIYNNNGGDGSDVQFDYLAITNVPEPVSAGMAGFGALSLLMRPRKRAR